MTQQEQILEYITRFGSITPMQAFSDLGITKLATRVGELKRKGVRFRTEPVRYTNRFGKSVRYCKYSFEGGQP